jgi:hypothetical protein
VVQFSGSTILADQWDDYNARFKALGNWVRNSVTPFDMALARGREGEALKSVWERNRQERVGFADSMHPFRLLGSGKLNAYKLFCELFWNLLRPDGRIGVILPTGIYSDFGTKDLREELLLRGRLDFLYAFQNEKRVFTAAHHAFKQTAVIATKGGRTKSFHTRFRMGVGDSPEAHEIPDDILSNHDAAMVFTPEDVRANSPRTLSLVELRCQRDLDLFRKVYGHSARIGDNSPGWEISYAQEINMTSDSKHFPPLSTWEAKGYAPDVFGQWIGPNEEIALPLLQGASVNQFDPCFKELAEAQGKQTLVESPFDRKRYRPKFLIDQETLCRWAKYSPIIKVGQRRIANPMNARSLTACVVRGLGCGDTLACLTVAKGDLLKSLIVSGLLNSLILDFVTRSKVVGVHIDWHHLEGLPLPVERLKAREAVTRLALAASSLTFIHRRFAPEWLRLKHLFPDLGAKEWKHWWAVTEADRLRLRMEIDALCADLYGLAPDDFDWIVRDDPSDPKGFYRVDRRLPFRERLTGLAAAAFRALKDGKWSAEFAAKLSNDEFFALLGIPEMTTGPDPLIRKRDGCHRWKPEEFGPADPRRGWTWDHCWQDAVALLGSEEAVRQYVEGKEDQATEEPDDEESGKGGQSDLFGQPLPRKQGKLF